MEEPVAPTPWTPRLHPPPLKGGVHVWRKQLHLGGDDDLALLSGEEADRAQRFVFIEHRLRFIARRAFLRRLLASYIGSCNTKDIEFEYGAMGKPALAPPYADLNFNLSVSHDWCLVAVTFAGQVGIDIEKRRDILSMNEVADTCFSPAELEEYVSIPPDEKERAFFDGWTRKEAFIKAIGKGLAFPLKNFDVSLGPDLPRIRRIESNMTPSSQWTLAPLDPVPGYSRRPMCGRVGCSCEHVYVPLENKSYVPKRVTRRCPTA